jgi:tellurite resistance protein TehA-like permease
MNGSVVSGRMLVVALSSRMGSAEETGFACYEAGLPTGRGMTQHGQVQDLNPAYFALVMATGVVSIILHSGRWPQTSNVLLGVALAALAVLLTAAGWSLVRYRGKTLAIAADPRRWFTWVVGTQTVAVAAASLSTQLAVRLAPLAVICWSVGILLYVIIATLVLTLLLHFRVNPAELTPPYWVFMGGSAISVVAGLQILRLRPGTRVDASSPVVGGVSVVLWDFGTWLIPLLLALGIWKHLVRRIRLIYEPALWSVVFVIGMYGLVSHGLGALLRLPWMVGLGTAFEWIMVVLWVVTFVAMLWSLIRARRPARTQSA